MSKFEEFETTTKPCTDCGQSIEVFDLKEANRAKKYTFVQLLVLFFKNSHFIEPPRLLCIHCKLYDTKLQQKQW